MAGLSDMISNIYLYVLQMIEQISARVMCDGIVINRGTSSSIFSIPGDNVSVVIPLMLAWVGMRRFV